MDSKSMLQKLSPLDIVVFHVGGVGGYGPVRKILDLFPERVVVVCFEANPSEKDLLVQKKYQDRGVRTIFVPKCIGMRAGKQRFYVNKHRASSSIFPPAPGAIDEHVVYEGINTWGENCELDCTVDVDMVTLDELVESRMLPSPDILSMDTQGSEMPIMQGGQRTVENTLCIVSEVDFIEIYHGQELFCAQQNFLSERGFRLADILNTQYWHPGPAAGLGFLTVGEALYLRDLKTTVAQFKKSDSKLLLYKLIKLAAIAYAFGRTSYSSKILTLILERFGTEAQDIFLAEKAFKPMYNTQQYMQKNYSNYLKDNKFFYRGSWKEDIVTAFTNTKRSMRRTIGGLLHFIRQSLRLPSEQIKHE